MLTALRNKLGISIVFPARIQIRGMCESAQNRLIFSPAHRGTAGKNDCRDMHFWISRKFCESCSPRFLQEQVKRAVIACATMFLLGMLAGQAAMRQSPPVVIQSAQNSISIIEAARANGPAQVEDNSSSGVNTDNHQQHKYNRRNLRVWREHG